MSATASNRRLIIYTLHVGIGNYEGQVIVTLDNIQAGRILRDEGAANFSTVEEARAAIRRINPGLTLIPRSPEDDPRIIESWI